MIDRPLLAICGIARSADPEQHPAFALVLNAFLLPEVSRRRETGSLQEGFDGIRSALVIFPAETPRERRVLLNDEIRVQVQVRVKYGGVEAGDPVRVSDLYDLTGLRLEGVREGKDAFFWVTQEPGRFALYFDLVPVLCEAEMPHEARVELHREIMDAMAQEHLRGFQEPRQGVVHVAHRQQRLRVVRARVLRHQVPFRPPVAVQRHSVAGEVEEHPVVRLHSCGQLFVEQAQ